MTDTTDQVDPLKRSMGAAAIAGILAAGAASCSPSPPQRPRIAPTPQSPAWRSNGYRLLYVAGDLCSTDHNYNSLISASEIDGVNLFYVRPLNSQIPYGDAPGEFLPFEDYADAGNFLKQYGLSVIDSTSILLLRPDNSIIEKFDDRTEINSKSPNFADHIRTLVQQDMAQQQAQGAAR